MVLMVLMVLMVRTGQLIMGMPGRARACGSIATVSSVHRPPSASSGVPASMPSAVKASWPGSSSSSKNAARGFEAHSTDAPVPARSGCCVAGRQVQCPMLVCWVRAWPGTCVAVVRCSCTLQRPCMCWWVCTSCTRRAAAGTRTAPMKRKAAGPARHTCR